MPKEIKTKQAVKGIKLLDKAAAGTAHVKNAFVKSKDAAEETQTDNHSNPEGYAADKMGYTAKSAAREAIARSKGFFKKPRQKAARNAEKAKEYFNEVRWQTPQARQEAARQIKQAAGHAKKTADTLKNRADIARKTAEQAQNPLPKPNAHLFRHARQGSRLSAPLGKV